MRTASRHAHTLKGVAGNIGALDLQAAAADLDERTANVGDETGIEPYLQNVVERLDPILEALAQINEPELAAAEPSESARELIGNLCALLQDGDAQAVETAAALRNHPQLHDYSAEIESMLQRIGEYDFDTALDSLNNLQKYLDLG